MARRPAADERQVDIFGAILPVPPASAPALSSARQTKPKQNRGRVRPAPNDKAPTETSMDALASRLSPAELDELAAVLSDDALAHLTLAAIRQLRRRLARSGGRSGGSRGKGRASALERIARQLAAELGGQAGGEGA